MLQDGKRLSVTRLCGPSHHLSHVCVCEAFFRRVFTFSRQLTCPTYTLAIIWDHANGAFWTLYCAPVNQRQPKWLTAGGRHWQMTVSWCQVWLHAGLVFPKQNVRHVDKQTRKQLPLQPLHNLLSRSPWNIHYIVRACNFVKLCKWKKKKVQIRVIEKKSASKAPSNLHDLWVKCPEKMLQ